MAGYMLIKIERDIRGEDFCMGVMDVERKSKGITGFFGYTVEDADTGLWQYEFDKLENEKEPGSTAIWYGLYEVILEDSGNYGPDWPTVSGVPFFMYIRFHPGNHSGHTKGCIMTGQYRDPDGIMMYEGKKVKGVIKNSKAWSDWLVAQIRDAKKSGERVYLMVRPK